MTPLVTLDPLPLKDGAGQDVAWRPQLLSTLQVHARETAALVGRVSTEGGAQAVDCWYQAPGATEAIGVDVESFVKRPYFVGLYYLRVNPGHGSVAYFKCSPTEGGDANARYVEANIDARRIEALCAELVEERARCGKLVDENTNLRGAVNDALDREAKTRRELAEVRDALEAAESAADPMLDEAGVGHVLSMGDRWLKEFAEGGEEGRAKGLLGQYFASDFHFSGRVCADVDLMTLVSARYGVEWEAHAKLFNEVSLTLAQGQPAHLLPDADQVRLLLPAAREAARAERERQIEEAERLVARHKGNRSATKGTPKGRAAPRAAARRRA